MKAGDLIDWSGTRWLVWKFERATLSAILISVDDASEVIPIDLDEKDPAACKIIANPAEQWPFLTLSTTSQFGRLTKVILPVTLDRERVLAPFVDWVRPDSYQMGGALFLNPALQLGLGHVIVAEYQKGKRVTIRVPKNFGTSVERVAKNTPSPVEEVRTAYDRLLSGDFDDDDD